MQSLIRRLRHSLSAHGTLTFVVPIGLTVGVLTLFAAISLNVLSVARAYVGGESHWSKAEKDAVFALHEYASTGAESDYQTFQNRMRVPLGDRSAKVELRKAFADDARIRKDLLAGQNDDGDIGGMVTLFRHAQLVPLMARAVEFWDQGDEYILQLRDVGSAVHELVLAHRQYGAAGQALVAKIQTIDTALAPIEDGFSKTLGDASRQVADVLIVAMICCAVALLSGATLWVRRSLAHAAQLQRTLVKSEERLSLGFQGSNAGLWDWDISAKTVYYSPWLKQLLGYPETHLSENPDDFICLIHPDDRNHVRNAFRAHFLACHPYEVEYRLKNAEGGYLWCKAQAIALKDGSGVPVRMVGSLFDITDRKAAEERAHAEHELAQVTLASIADAVIRTDALGRVTYCNPVAESMFGRIADQLYMKPFGQLCKVIDADGTETVCDLVARVLRQKAPAQANRNLLIMMPNGRRISVDRSVAPLHDAGARVIGSVIVLHDVTEEHKQAAQLSYQATHDELTGMLNRREFERRLTALLENNQAEYFEHGVLCLDLDRFKVINDTCGHAAGDDLLRAVSAALKSNLRSGDIVGRLGGDEFGIVLAHCNKGDAARIAESIRCSIADLRFVWANRTFTTGVSVGLVVPPVGMVDLKDVVKAADLACYMAKEKGKNRVQIFNYDDEELAARHRELEWVSRIRAAIENDRFCLYTQKVVPVNASSIGQPLHVEILLRMLGDDGKLIAPNAFIPSAERFGLMSEIDRWVIRNAFAALAEFCRAAPREHMWAINLSGASVGDDLLLEYILAQEAQTGISLRSVCFEITETAAITNFDKAATLITRLRERGCKFALDDFGAGMSSFAYLKNLPVDYLKIDGSFVKEIISGSSDRAIVESINQIGHALGKQTIAEFVESEDILICLKLIGVDYAQGYAIGRPVPMTSLKSQHALAS